MASLKGSEFRLHRLPLLMRELDCGFDWRTSGAIHEINGDKMSGCLLGVPYWSKQDTTDDKEWYECPFVHSDFPRAAKLRFNI